MDAIGEAAHCRDQTLLCTQGNLHTNRKAGLHVAAAACCRLLQCTNEHTCSLPAACFACTDQSLATEDRPVGTRH